MKKNQLGRRSVVRIVSFITAGILVLAGFLVKNYLEKERYKEQLEVSYQHYFDELAEAMRGISDALQKSRYSNSPAMAASLANEVTREASAAQSAMSGLPFANIELEKTAKFLSQVGDFAYYLTRRDAAGEGITDGERQSLRELTKTAYSLAESMDELYYAVAEGSMSVTGAIEGESRDESGLGGIADTLAEMETQFPEYASLIYDGPFSEHILSREPVLLAGRGEVTVEAAAETAAKAGGFETHELTFEGESAGTVPAYSFSAERDGAAWYFDVTKAGGVLIEMYSSYLPEETALEAEDCVARAKDWLASLGMENMTESYYFRRDGVVTANFAASENGVVCYPDLVKVSVAADTGKIVGMEARGYIMNHTERDLPPVQVSEEAARAALSPEVTVENARLCVIPSAGEYERFCHEFLCSDSSGRRVLIYVNAETGIEEQILILLESEDGTLAI